MLAGRHWLRKATMLLALCAGGVAASAPNAPAAASWTADPDEQFLLDVTIRQLRLGDGVRAYNTPEGTCVVLGDFLTALDVPMRIDLAGQKASGWAFKESHRITIDYAAGSASYGNRSETLSPGTVRQTPEGWCVQASALTRWFGIGVKPVTAGSVLMLQSEAKLPVELAIERKRRAASIKPAKFELAALPTVRVPYRMWRAPALDFVVSAGVTYRAKDGARIDRQSAVYAAGEFARLSYDAQLTTTQKGKPSTLRFHAYRSDPDGQLLGPARATHFGVGDVESFDSHLSGSPARGRGAIMTNRPLNAPAAFGRTRFEGDLPNGWEAELYRNDELLAFAKSRPDQRYAFEDIQLLYGENRVRVVLYGPQGQVRTHEELINVGRDNAPPGKTWYWAGFSQPSRDIVTLHKPPDGSNQPRAQATAALEHGIDERTSVAALARTMLLDDKDRLTFVEGTVRRAVGTALVEIGVGRESTGGTAARAQLVGKFGAVNVNAEALIANDFHLQGIRHTQQLRDYRASLQAPLKIGRTVVPANADIRFASRGDGTRQLDAAARLSANFQRFNLASTLRYRKHMSEAGNSPAEVGLDLMGSGRVRDVRLRGTTSFDISPGARFRTAELSAYWSASDTVDWEGDLVYDAIGKRGRAKVSHIRRLDSMAVALTGEAATDRSLALGLNVNFSLDPRRGLSLSRRPLAQSGIVRATVYRDLNDNGIRDAAEPVEKGALITTGTRQAEKPTDSRGEVTVPGLAPYIPVTVGIDQSSLADPMLVPRRALQVVVPRRGVPAEVEIGLVGGGDIEGAVVKSGGIGFEGLDLELLDASGRVVATTRTDFDGFFLFERVAYGAYRVRVAKASAEIAKIGTELAAQVQVTADKSIVRLGAIPVVPVAVVAAVLPDPASP
jgi:hypothetical protein